MDKCPSCNENANMGWRKATMSPLASMPCEQCDVELTVSWKSYLLASFPASIFFLLAYLLLEEDSNQQYVAFALSIAVMVFCQLKFMPLIKDTKSNNGSELDNEG